MSRSTLDRPSPVDTKQAARRQLEFASLDEVLADAEQAVAQQAPTTGNWSQGQIFDHLAKATTCFTDGFGIKAPFYYVFLGPILRRVFLSRGMPTGFQLTGKLLETLGPIETSPEEGLESLRTATSRYQEATECAPHPYFGKLSYEEGDRMCCRHAALHMSFIDLTS